MNTNSLNIKIVKSPDEAPNYKELEEKHSPLSLDEVVVVRKGTVKKKSTVDIVLIDENGNKFITMTTGKIITALAKIIDEPEN